MKVLYPETGFMIMMFLENEKSKVIIPFDTMYATAKQGILALEHYQKRIENFTGKRKITGVTIIQLKYGKEFDLKKEYWKGKHDKDLWRYKIKSNLDFLSKPRLYQYMVVPCNFDDKTKEWKLAVSNPFFITDDNDTMEKYILASNEYVDPRAKNAATYTVEKMWGMNWKTREIKEVDTEMLDEVPREMIN